MIAQVDRDGNGKISIEGMSFIINHFPSRGNSNDETVEYFFFLIEFAALVERES